MKIDMVATGEDRGAEGRREPSNKHRAGVRGNPARRDRSILWNEGTAVAGIATLTDGPSRKNPITGGEHVKRLGIALLVVALMFVGLHAFGSVNQFEIEPALTVEALMLPNAERTVEVSVAFLADITAYAEEAVTPYYDSLTKEAVYCSGSAYFLRPIPAARSQAMIGYVPGRGTDRLKYPLSGSVA